MIAIHNPSTAPAPASRYAQGASAPAGAQWLHISGQVGLTPEGKLAGGCREQMEQCWQNIIAVLADAGMERENLVKVTAYITSAEDTPIYREVRDRMLNAHVCASTLIVVAGLAHPDWAVEIEAVAAA